MFPARYPFFKLGYGQLFVGMSPVTLLLFQSQNNSEGLSGLVCREEKLSKLSDVSKENVKQEGKYILTNIIISTYHISKIKDIS